MLESAISKRSALFLGSSVLLSGALLAGCGGGSGDPGAGATAAGSSTGSTSSTGAAIVLDNLPQKQTTSVSASIGYEVTAANASATVYCRLDNYAPIVCPNSFDLGRSTPLAAGDHVVDYYVDTGSGIDLSTPTASYTWTIAAAAATITPTTSTPTTPSTSAAALLAKLAPMNWEGNGYDGSWSGQTMTGSDGLARVQALSDGYLMRTVNGDTKVWSSNRSEFSWSGQQNLQKGVDYWYAFAVKPVEYDPTGRQIFFQLQMANNIGGCGGPTLEFQMANGVVVVNKNVGATTLTCSNVASNLGAVTVGQWSKWVVHVRPGYQADQNPLLEVWRDGVKVLTHADITSSPNSNDYAKIGIYKWDNTWGSVNSRAMNYSPVYFGQGVDLKANADASIAAY